MSIIYLISVLLLLSTFVLVKKTNEKINLISFISISIVVLFCYNAFICYVLTYFKIPITLLVLSIINYLISFVIIFLIYKRKEIQKFIFNKIHLLYISLMLLVVLIIVYTNFGIPFNIKYETSDPSVHYLTSIMFAESDSLLANEEPDPIYGNLGIRKIASYVNSGLLMKCFCSNLEPMECYNVFVIFGALTLLLTGTTLYGAFVNCAKTKEHYLWAFLLALICMIGYPLNSYLFGFEYLSMGLLILCAIIDLIYYYEKNFMKKYLFIAILSLFNFGLFMSYYMFVPFVYVALGVYLYIKILNKTKKIISLELVNTWIIALIIPFILGFIYNLAPQTFIDLVNKNDNSTLLKFLSIILIGSGIYLYFKKYKKSIKINKNIIISIVISLILIGLVYVLFIKPSIYNSIVEKFKVFLGYANVILYSGFATEGYIYINLYSNMLLLLPLSFYLVFKDSKKDSLKHNKFIIILLTCCMAFILILFKGYENGNVSIYYLSKNYFALWIILIYCNFQALMKLSETEIFLPRLFLGSYIFLMIICTILSDVKMIDDALINPDEKVFSVMEVFGANKTMLLKEKEKLNQDEIEILMYARDNLDYSASIEVATEGIQYYWSYVWLRYCNYEPVLDTTIFGQRKLNLKSYYLYNKINNVDYMIYFNRSQSYKRLKDVLFYNSEVIYENDAGGIIRYNR